MSPVGDGVVCPPSLSFSQYLTYWPFLSFLESITGLPVNHFLCFSLILLVTALHWPRSCLLVSACHADLQILEQLHVHISVRPLLCLHSFLRWPPLVSGPNTIYKPRPLPELWIPSPTAYLTSLLWCLVDISNLLSRKPFISQTSFHPISPSTGFPISINILFIPKPETSTPLFLWQHTSVRKSW